MKTAFYPRLAVDSMKKNRQLYLPFILAASGMVLIFYILSYLAHSAFIRVLRGGSELSSIMNFGSIILAFFSAIFLFYTHSFLLRRRKTEFGLYNILGMDKRSLARILIWETLIMATVSLISGSLGGILLSKLAELILLRLVKSAVSFSLSIDLPALLNSVVVFMLIFALILLQSLLQIWRSNPIELLHSQATGEKPPRGNWVLALAGVLLLVTAYSIALSIKDPIAALFWFFLAVILVIAATYLLFIAGSVTACRQLQKNKRFYYQKQHFVSLSSMAYRMKRNGAGLASIAILCTMVLVMLSTTVCLYAGTEDILRTRFPRELSVSAKISQPLPADDSYWETLQQQLLIAPDQTQLSAQNLLSYQYAYMIGQVSGDQVRIAEEEDPVVPTSDLISVIILPQQDYNQISGSSLDLAPGQALLYANRLTYAADSLTINDAVTLQINQRLSTADSLAEVEIITEAAGYTPELVLVVSDYASLLTRLQQSLNDAQQSNLYLSWNYAFDLKGSDSAIAESQQLSYWQGKLDTLTAQSEGRLYSLSVNAVSEERSYYYSTYSGLLFMAALLALVFILATVLIMYYKQLSEGYEDQSRFAIMQKIGMTTQDIRQSINSQILTVFLLPLLAAGLHLAFAFPMLQKLLLLFGLSNHRLFVSVALLCFVLFTLFYALIYRVTSHVYYHIVSKNTKA
ncbi:ABC transporter permease [Oscillospiraceae bacterium HV4-5-C5C]|nr:ABC transporter permease [Oscillospiraceae bacterium HV4-5-C5C]